MTRTQQLAWLFFFSVFEICFIAGFGAFLMTAFGWFGLLGLPFLFAAGVLTWVAVLGFIDEHFEVEKVKKITQTCSKCQTEMLLENIDNKGTTIHVCFPSGKKTKTIRRNAIMPFNWLTFVCPKCGWRHTITDRE